MRTPLALWSPVEARRTIGASPEQVFAVLSDPTTYPDWLVGAQRIRSVDASFPRPGAAFDHSVGPTSGVTVDDSTEVLESEPPDRLVLRVHVGPLDGTVELLVLADPGGADVRFRERPAGLAQLVTPAIRGVLYGRNLESLRRLDGLVGRRADAAPRWHRAPRRRHPGGRAQRDARPAPVRAGADGGRSGARGGAGQITKALRTR